VRSEGDLPYQGDEEEEEHLQKGKTVAKHSTTKIAQGGWRWGLPELKWVRKMGSCE
jgi:hypothetical protein